MLFLTKKFVLFGKLGKEQMVEADTELKEFCIHNNELPHKMFQGNTMDQEG